MSQICYILKASNGEVKKEGFLMKTHVIYSLIFCISFSSFAMDTPVGGRDQQKTDSLLKAAASGHSQEIKNAMIESLIAPAEDGDTPLLIAVRASRGNLSPVAELCKFAGLGFAKQPDAFTDFLNQRNKKVGEGAPINVAVGKAFTKITKYLLGEGADVKQRSHQFDRTTLMVAASSGKVDLVQVLLEHAKKFKDKGIDFINRLNDHNQSALSLANFCEDEESKTQIIALLKAAGATESTATITAGHSLDSIGLPTPDDLKMPGDDSSSDSDSDLEDDDDKFNASFDSDDEGNQD